MTSVDFKNNSIILSFIRPNIDCLDSHAGHLELTPIEGVRRYLRSIYGNSRSHARLLPPNNVRGHWDVGTPMVRRWQLGSPNRLQTR